MIIRPFDLRLLPRIDHYFKPKIGVDSPEHIPMFTV